MKLGFVFTIIIIIIVNIVSVPQAQGTSDRTEESAATAEQLVLERKQQLELKFGKVCMWCFSYSKRRTLDCLQRSIIERYLYLLRHMCLVKTIYTK